jgi:hypothetical protein
MSRLIARIRGGIVFISGAALLLALLLLFHPLGKDLAGDGDASAAITSALGLIVATAGLVLALYMQSAEYRREAEVVDGLQRLRAILELMLARCVATLGTEDRSGGVFQKERELLLEALSGPAGRFLTYLGAIRGEKAGKGQVEKWRTFHLYVANVMQASCERDCVVDLVELHDMVAAISSEDISLHSAGFISAASIDELNKHGVPPVAAQMINKVRRHQAEQAKVDPFGGDDGALERTIAELSVLIARTDQGLAAWEDLGEPIRRAREGSAPDRTHVFELHKLLAKQGRPH